MKLQAVMTSSVGNYAQSVESLLDFVRKTVILVDRRGHQKGMARTMMSGFGRPALAGGAMDRGPGPRNPKQSKPSSARSKTSRFFNQLTGGRSFDTDEAKSSGSQADMSPWESFLAVSTRFRMPLSGFHVFCVIMKGPSCVLMGFDTFWKIRSLIITVCECVEIFVDFLSTGWKFQESVVRKRKFPCSISDFQCQSRKMTNLESITF